LLPPVDVRSLTPPFETLLPAYGGLIVADGREIKRLDRFGVVVGTFNAGSGPDSKKNWIDVALDPDTQDFWGVDAGETTQLVKFRIGGANQLVVSPLSAIPRGVAVNGELRAAQVTRAFNLTAGNEGVAKFLEPPFQHSWKGISPVGISIAIQAFEVIYDPSGATPDPCLVSLDVRCRLQKFINEGANPIPKTYSRGRSVVYREILLSALTDPSLWTISFVFPANNTDRNHAGVPCVPGIVPEGSSGVLRDPYPHDFFSIDPSLAFFGGDDVIPIKSRGNDSIVVDRADGVNNGRSSSRCPGQLAIQSSLPIAVEVTNPRLHGRPASRGQAEVVDITVVNGRQWTQSLATARESRHAQRERQDFAKVASRYRTNLVDQAFQKDHNYRPASRHWPQRRSRSSRAAGGGVCQDISTRVGPPRLERAGVAGQLAGAVLEDRLQVGSLRT
jgi:hypothetical protein